VTFWKRQLPGILVFVVGILLVVQYYIPHPWSSEVLGESNRWVRIIQNAALLLGVASLVGNHYRKIARKQAGFGYSYIALFFFLAMVVFGFATGISAPREIRETVTIPAGIATGGGEVPTDVDVESGFALSLMPALGKPLPNVTLRGKVDGGQTVALSDDTPVQLDATGKLILVVPPNTSGEPVTVGLFLKEDQSIGYWMFDTFKVSMEASMYSLLAFFISSAAFRAFRARSIDATIMLIAAIIMMIGRVSFGEMISRIFSKSWLFFPKACEWMLNVPVTAAKRAIFIGIALSVIALSIRIIFGLERSYLGRGE